MPNFFTSLFFAKILHTKTVPNLILIKHFFKNNLFGNYKYAIYICSII